MSDEDTVNLRWTDRSRTPYKPQKHIYCCMMDQQNSVTDQETNWFWHYGSNIIEQFTHITFFQ